MKAFRGKLESACLSIHVSVCPCRPGCVHPEISSFLSLFVLWLVYPDFFSSPEHNLLRVSYCDKSLSGVVREQILKKSCPLKPANRFQ